LIDHGPVYLYRAKSITRFDDRISKAQFSIDAKTFLRFLLWSRFLTFLTFFFIFQTFLFLENVGKFQSGKQVN